MTTTPFQTKTAANGSKKLSYKTAGQGQAIVLFHSLLADQSSFDPLAAELAKTHQVIQLSLPVS